MKNVYDIVKLGLDRITPSALLVKARNMIKEMTGNANFTRPVPALATAADALETAIEDAIQGSRHSREVRDAQVKAVRSILTQTGNYVRTAANGDAAILASSGFEMAKVPEPVGLPAEPTHLRIVMGPTSGCTSLKWRRVHGATSYQVLRTDKDPAVEANWETVSTTSKVSLVDGGLESFKAYWYCVRAIGFAGEGDACAPLMGRAA